MRSVGIKTLKNKLSEYVRLVAAGETVLVTNHDRVVAELVPPRSDHASSGQDKKLAEAIQRGEIAPAKTPIRGEAPRAPVVSFDELMKGLDEDRDER